MSTVQERLARWRQDLLDLSNRNRLLSFRVSTARPSSIQLVEPDASAIFRTLVDGRPVELVGEEDDAGADEAQLLLDLSVPTTERSAPSSAEAPRLPPGAARSSLPPEQTNRVALRLAARARSSEQEQGVNTLFAAFGLLRWQEQPGEATWRFAPLVLLPVRLREHPRHATYVLSLAGDDPEFNHTLAERLRRDFGLAIDPDVDEATDLAEVFARVGAEVAARPGWEVRPEVHVGIFQFHKLRMFEDLAEHAAVAAGHPIVQALASDLATIPGLPDGVPAMEDLDRVVPPEATHAILDADASQLQAIEAVKRGAHVVIEGPPGTGKSQTIANVVAESVAAGQTVLFVSEKAAAIEVVHRRLAACGLGELCLMLHSHRAGKREVIQELGDRLEALSVPESLSEGDGAAALADVRARLDRYVRALHEVRAPLGRSVFWAYGALAQLRDEPYLPPAGLGVEDLTAARLEEGEALVGRLARFAADIAEDDHPWAGVRPEAASFAQREALRDALDAGRNRVVAVRDAAARLAEGLGLPSPESLGDARAALAVASALPDDPALTPDWLDPVAIERKVDLVAAAASRARRIRELERSVGEAYGEAVFALPVDDAIRAYEAGFVRYFSPAYWSFRGQIKAAAKGPWDGAADRVLEALRLVREVRDNRAWFAGADAELARGLGLEPGRAGRLDAAEWDRLAARVAAVRALLAQFPSGVTPAGFVAAVTHPAATSTARLDATALTRVLEALDRDLRTLSGAFEPGATIAGVALNEVSFAGLLDWLDRRRARFSDLDAYVQSRAALAAVEREGLGPLVAAVRERGVPPERWAAACRKHSLTHWLAWAIEQNPVLRDFDPDEQEAATERFQRLDRDFLGETAPRVLHEASLRARRVTAAHAGEPAVLRHEYRKRKRHLPLRRLFGRIPNLLPILKPCLMMSPLSVAQFLPADRFRFDLVVFDEASQVRPHDAIGAIMRGRQLVVAGDPRQLPPTTFFDRALDDPEAEDEQDIRALESVLDAVTAKGMPLLPLLWHYRSRHEHLIAWSNHQIYGGRLVTFPGPSSEPEPHRGVRLEYVEGGVYEDVRDGGLGTPVRVNPAEAARVVELVTRHARERPDETLGVVTLNMHQRDLVEEELKRARAEDPALDEFWRDDRPEPFLVKALEQIQGDERDVVVVSVGYGKDRRGVLSHNFGPINQEGGQRRLNVLVTRARNQVVVVSSIRAGDIDLSRTQKEGPRLLKNYLDYAERGPVALGAEVRSVGQEHESPFEEAVAAALARAGWTVHAQVGVSRFRIDLAVVHPAQPGRYLLGIECDGRTYHSLKTVRDRDRLRQEILEGLGWEIHRVWSTEWMRDPDRELARITSRLQALLSSDARRPQAAAEAPQPAEPPGSTPNRAPEVQRAVAPAPPVPLSRHYQVADVPVVRPGDLLNAPFRSLVDAVAACVEVEGPIHEELLTRRIAAAWSHARAGARITAKVASAVRAAEVGKRVRRRGPFLWPADERALELRVGTPDGAVRNIAHVSPEEQELAIAVVLREALSLPADELVVHAARALGYARTGADIDRSLRSAVQRGLVAGKWSLVAGRVQVWNEAGVRA